MSLQQSDKTKINWGVCLNCPTPPPPLPNSLKSEVKGIKQPEVAENHLPETTKNV